MVGSHLYIWEKTILLMKQWQSKNTCQTICKLGKKTLMCIFKSIEDRKTFTQGLNQFFEEMSVISHIKHRNIINIIDYFEMNNTAYIVTPYEYGMPLSSYISSLKYEQIRCAEQDVLKIFIGILEAVKALHENNILHLDLKIQYLVETK